MEQSGQQTPLTQADEIRAAIAQYLADRLDQLLPCGRQSRDGRRFAWCGEVFDFLIEGVMEQLASRGVTFTTPYPGPFRLMDEDQLPDGRHIRRFWTVACADGCPITRLCTRFVHRHDDVRLPEAPQVDIYPLEQIDPSESAAPTESLLIGDAATPHCTNAGSTWDKH